MTLIESDIEAFLDRFVPYLDVDADTTGRAEEEVGQAEDLPPSPHPPDSPSPVEQEKAGEEEEVGQAEDLPIFEAPPDSPSPVEQEKAGEEEEEVGEPEEAGETEPKKVSTPALLRLRALLS